MYKIGINASRARSGGCVLHLQKILLNYSHDKFPIVEIHVWGYEDILKSIPNDAKFIKHVAFNNEKSMAYQLIWEKYFLPRKLKKFKCELLINLDAGSFCRFTPNITMSRDMLSYEKGIMNKYFFSISWLRLVALKYVQIWSLKKATKVIFLTNYARQIIEKAAKYSFDSTLIPHGIDITPVENIPKRKDFSDKFQEIVYVSNFDLYKNQHNVISAFKLLLKKHTNLRLHLVGAFSNQDYYNKCIELAENDERIFFHGAVKQSEIQGFLISADILLFASSCENMPNTLLEYMSAKKPILCSNKGPMPEVLGDWNYYFNPEDIDSLVYCLDQLILDFLDWNDIAKSAFDNVQKYSWEKSSDALFDLSTNLIKHK